MGQAVAGQVRTLPMGCSADKTGTRSTEQPQTPRISIPHISNSTPEIEVPAMRKFFIAIAIGVALATANPAPSATADSTSHGGFEWSVKA